MIIGRVITKENNYMKNRYLAHVHDKLSQTINQSLFSSVSSIYELQQSSMLLSNNEIGKKATELIRDAQQEVVILFHKFNSQSDLGGQIYEALLDLKLKAEQTNTKINVRILLDSLHPLPNFFYRQNN